MKVAVMLSGLAMGGAERNIVNFLPHLRNHGVDVTLFSLNTRRDSPLAQQFEATGIERVDFDAKRMTDHAAWKRFVRAIGERKIELVHAQDQDSIIYSGLAHRRHQIPNIMTRHVMVEPQDTMKETARAQLLLLTARFEFDHIITVSEAVRQEFSHLAHIPLERITTVYNGLDMEKFRLPMDKRAETRANLGWGADEKVVLMVAVLRRGKGHEVLFKAIPSILEQVPDARFKLVGDGEIADQVREWAEPYKDVVEFLGQRTDVPELLLASDVLVQASWSEALPTVLIEAGASSLPVVATDVGGSREIVVEGETGYLIDAGDVYALAQNLVRVLQDLDAAQAMGQRAYQHVTRLFSLDRQAQQTASLYERVLFERGEL